MSCELVRDARHVFRVFHANYTSLTSRHCGHHICGKRWDSELFVSLRSITDKFKFFKKQLIIYQEGYTTECIFTNLKYVYIIIIITYLPFHGFQFSDFKQLTNWIVNIKIKRSVCSNNTCSKPTLLWKSSEILLCLSDVKANTSENSFQTVSFYLANSFTLLSQTAAKGKKAEKRDSRCHSTTTFYENVVVGKLVIKC